LVKSSLLLCGRYGNYGSRLAICAPLGDYYICTWKSNVTKVHFLFLLYI
jgi:hypothetical protein